jgi:hypothetical protein
VGAGLDKEGQKEAAFLAKNNMIQDWDALASALRQKGFHIVTFVTGNLFIKNPANRKVYAALGHVVEIKQNKSQIITSTMLQTLFTLLGQASPKQDDIVYHFMQSETNQMAQTSHLEPIVKLDIRDVLKTADPSFVLAVFDKLLDPRNPDRARCLTTNPIIGKYWRLVCGTYRRKDEGKYELLCQQTINKLSQVVNNISDLPERKFMQDWISESHDDEDLIQEMLARNFATNEYKSVLTLPADCSVQITRDDVLELGRGGDFKTLALAIAEIQLIPAPSSPPDETPTFVPYSNDMNSMDVMQLLGNLLSHKMVLSKSVGLLAAILALKNTILAEHALTALKANVGNWIDWSLDVDQKQNTPMCWSMNFITLLKLAPDDVLTLPERNFRDHYHKVSHMTRVQHARMTIEVPLILEEPRRNVTWKRLCRSCGISRCFSIFPGNSDVCGLCIALDPTDANRWYQANLNISNQYGHSMDPKKYVEPNDSETNWAQCYTCHANYGIIDTRYLNVRPKCHACRTGDPNETVTCCLCKHKYSSPNGSAMLAFRANCANGGESEFTCPRCVKSASGMQTEVEVKLSDFVAENLEAIQPFLPSNFNAMMDEKVKFWKRVLNSKEAARPAERDDDAKMHRSLVYKGFPILNATVCIDKFCDMLSSTDFAQAVCGLCFEDVPVRALNACCGSCANTMCTSCIANWYGKTSLGEMVSENHTKCPFCKSVPKFSVIRHLGLRHLRNIRTTNSNKGRNLCEWDPHFVYAACLECRCAKPALPRQCVEESLPEIKHFVCEDCVNKKTKQMLDLALDAPPTKECPSCHSTVSKDGGCNHISCTQCHTHWCWSCGSNKDPTTQVLFDATTIYRHMTKCGGIWPQQPPQPYFANDTDESD